MADEVTERVAIKCRCGYTEARVVSAVTNNVPGYHDGLPYFIHVCLRCGAEYPNMAAAKVARQGATLPAGQMKNAHKP